MNEESSSSQSINKMAKIENPTDVRHISHITWSKHKGFEINTDDEEMAKSFEEIFNKAPALNSEEEIVDFISNEFNTMKDNQPSYVSYPYNIRHNVHCEVNKSSDTIDIVNNGNIVKLKIEEFFKKYSKK